jgi:hypothetical protein
LKKSNANCMNRGVARACAANYSVVQTATRLFREEYSVVPKTFIIQCSNAFHATHVTVQINTAECIQDEPTSQIHLLHRCTQPGKNVSNMRESSFEVRHCDVVERSLVPSLRVESRVGQLPLLHPPHSIGRRALRAAAPALPPNEMQRLSRKSHMATKRARASQQAQAQCLNEQRCGAFQARDAAAPPARPQPRSARPVEPDFGIIYFCCTIDRVSRLSVQLMSSTPPPLHLPPPPPPCCCWRCCRCCAWVKFKSSALTGLYRIDHSPPPPYRPILTPSTLPVLPSMAAAPQHCAHPRAAAAAPALPDAQVIAAFESMSAAQVRRAPPLTPHNRTDFQFPPPHPRRVTRAALQVRDCVRRRQQALLHTKSRVETVLADVSASTCT